uniref:Tf2-1-like SH3-like domain-containing protein n=1 Tax=Tanacetum cinerariifolium TaxID=118510 RepID=A0A6L2KQ49_TANCI|nr:hypothetical protein [Tanacetum cinerariifolium]
MTKQANKHRMEKQFQVGDLVYLRLRNYRQTSVEARENQKLSKRYFGPYRVLEKIGSVAYRLQLPNNSRVHPVFHVEEEVLIKWKHHDTSEATWEDWLEFMHHFSVFVGHEDMSAVQGETNDTPEPSAAVQTKAAQDKARPTRIIKKPARYLE